MRKISVGFLILFCQLTFAAQIINYGDEFSRLFKTVNTMTEDERYDALIQFEAQYPTIYDHIIYQKGTPNWQERKNTLRQKFLQKLPHLFPKMNVLFTTVNKLIIHSESQFKQKFASLSDNISVYILPSMLSFNGRVAFVPDSSKKALFIGIDYIADTNENLSILFSHEYFHLYHDGKWQNDADKAIMANPLWTEGFATYVSELLNPTASETDILMAPDLAEKCKNKVFRQALAQEFLPLLETDGKDTYNNWFSMGGDTKPYRRGYCLGYHVVKIIAQNHNLDDMVMWNQSRFTQEIKKVLVQLFKQ